MNLKPIKIVVDTRNQDDSFVIKGLEDLGFEMGRDILRTKLPFGDIALATNLLNAIDLKSSGGGLIELSKNICSSKDHKRLKNEINKCLKFGGTLTFLCFETENDNNIRSVADVHKWQVPKFKSNLYKNLTTPEGEKVKILLHKKGELMTKVNPSTLQKALETMSEPNHYGENTKVDFEFTNKKDCATKILEILLRSENYANWIRSYNFI